MGKTLTQPVFVLLIVQFVCVAACWPWFRKRDRSVSSYRWFVLLAVAVLLLAVLSLPVVGDLLLRSLTVESPQSSRAPDFIVVLAGGYDEGDSPDLDALSAETTKRVLMGVRCWKMNPSARIVMTGTGPGRPLGRETELMAEVARCHGVPAELIVLEPHAMNTREHPLRLKDIRGVTPTSNLAIVTSSWHERRAIAEFRRSFTSAFPQPARSRRTRRFDDWFPSNRGLNDSTTAIHEWIGQIWYRVSRAPAF